MLELAELPRYIPDAQRVIQLAIKGKTRDHDQPLKFSPTSTIIHSCGYSCGYAVYAQSFMWLNAIMWLFIWLSMINHVAIHVAKVDHSCGYQVKKHLLVPEFFDLSEHLL